MNVLRVYLAVLTDVLTLRVPTIVPVHPAINCSRLTGNRDTVSTTVLTGGCILETGCITIIRASVWKFHISCDYS